MPRFTRVLFGLSPSPFLLGGVIEQQLKSWRSTRPESVRGIQKSLYMDDLITGTTTAAEARELKVAATAIFANTTFEQHKWHSNVPALESAETEAGTGDQSFAKQQLGVPRGGDCSLLGLRWNKQRDAISVAMPTEKAETTKRGILAKIAKIFDPLGLALPLTLGSKLLYRDACNLRVMLDAQLPADLARCWNQ